MGPEGIFSCLLSHYTRASKPPLARVPGVGILRTPRHLQLGVVELVVLVALEEVGLAVGVGGGGVQVVGDPLPVGDRSRVGGVH